MKMTKNVKYAISWLYSQGNSVSDIAEELKLDTEQVSEYIEKNHPQGSTPDIPTTTSPVNKKSKDLMIRHTRDKRVNSVSIMTKEASEVNDSLRPKLCGGNNKNEDCIFRPNN